MYHGWSDPQVAPGTSINYYNRVTKAMGGVATAMVSVRLFMVPGMGHCRGGEGPNTFERMKVIVTTGRRKARPRGGIPLPGTRRTARLIERARSAPIRRWRGTQARQHRRSGEL